MQATVKLSIGALGKLKNLNHISFNNQLQTNLIDSKKEKIYNLIEGTIVKSLDFNLMFPKRLYAFRS